MTWNDNPCFLLDGGTEKLDYKKMLDDGIHPNAEGHQWLMERVSGDLN